MADAKPWDGYAVVGGGVREEVFQSREAAKAEYVRRLHLLLHPNNPRVRFFCMSEEQLVCPTCGQEVKG